MVRIRKKRGEGTVTETFPLLSGHLSLDLVNTEVVRRGKRHDLLLTDRNMLDWLNVIREDHSVWDERLMQAKEKAATVLHQLREFRTMLRNQFEQIADGQMIPITFITLLEQKVERAPFTYKLMEQTLIPIPIGEIEDVLISLIAFDALTLLAKHKLHHLKRCSNPDCVLLFIDESGRRKWCSMKICGNRKKAARFQLRKSE